MVTTWATTLQELDDNWGLGPISSDRALARRSPSGSRGSRSSPAPEAGSIPPDPFVKAREMSWEVGCPGDLHERDMKGGAYLAQNPTNPSFSDNPADSVKPDSYRVEGTYEGAHGPVGAKSQQKV